MKKRKFWVFQHRIYPDDPEFKEGFVAVPTPGYVTSTLCEITMRPVRDKRGRIIRRRKP